MAVWALKLKHIVRLVLAIAIAVLTGVSAQVMMYIGPVPYTMQNTGVVLAGLLLPPSYALASQLIYLAMIALGLPMAAGLRGGIHVILGYTGGYLIAFPISSMLMSLLSRAYLRRRGVDLSEIGRRDFAILLLLSAIAVLPIYILGFAVFSWYALGNEKLFKWASSVARGVGIHDVDPVLVIFIASVAVFIPQDIFMDHVIAIATAKGIRWFMVLKGVEVER